jgi:RNA polymerase sigma-70 factor (ECF subfamily)
VNADALAEHFRKYGYFVRRRCVLLLSNEADAEDVTQEVFLRVLRYSASLTAPVTLAWLYAIAARCCYDRTQRRGRDEPMQTQALLELERPPDDQSSPDLRALVGQLVRGHDRQTSELAILHYLEGWTHEEIAEQTGCSRKTIGKRLANFNQDFKAAWAQTERLRKEVGT